MGRQVGFFAIDRDLHELLVFAEQRGFLAVPDLIDTDEEPDGVLPTKMRLTETTEAHCFHLLPPEIFPAEVFYTEVVWKPGISRVKKNVSPVTEVRPSQREDIKLSDGRIHFNMDSDVSFFEKGEKGYQLLARYVRKWEKTKQYRFFVGPHAATDVRNGRLILSHWGEELSIA